MQEDRKRKEQFGGKVKEKGRKTKHQLFGWEKD